MDTLSVENMGEEHIIGEVMTEESRSQAEEIKDQFIDIIWETSLDEEDLNYIFECVRDEWRSNQ